MKPITIFGFILVAAIISGSTDAKLFKKKKWLPKLFKKVGSFGDKTPVEFVDHPKIVEIVKHVPVIQKVEVIKPVEIIKTITVPVEVIKEIEIIKYIPVMQEVIKEVEVIRTVEVPVEIIKEIEVIKEIPVIKTVEVAKPYEVIRHIPIVKTVEVEKEVIKKVPVAQVSHYTKEISLPKITLPSLPKVSLHHKSPLSYLTGEHEYENQFETSH